MESARETELLRRLGATYATYRHLAAEFDEDVKDQAPPAFEKLGGLISALGHDLAGTEGCLDPEEWNMGRRAAAVAYDNESSVRDLPLPPAPQQKVQGRCPVGCGPTLFLAEGGHVTCSSVTCPNPSAVDEMLSPAAAEQRQQEETAVKGKLEDIEHRLEVTEEAARVLLELLKDSHWLRTASAFMELNRLVVDQDGL